MDWVPKGGIFSGGDKDGDSECFLKRVFCGWFEYMKRTRDIQKQRAEEVALSTRRMREWLSRKEAQMAQIRPVAELKALIQRNLNSRGPLQLLGPRRMQQYVDSEDFPAEDDMTAEEVNKYAEE